MKRSRLSYAAFCGLAVLTALVACSFQGSVSGPGAPSAATATPTVTTPTATPSPLPTAAPVGTPFSGAGPLLYVDGVTAVNSLGTGVIAAYPLTANGNVSAVRVLGGPHTGLPDGQTGGLDNPGPMSFDGSGRVYTVQRWGNGAGGLSEISAYAATAAGDAAPVRWLDKDYLQVVLALAVDGPGAVYAIGADFRTGILVFSNTATGKADALGAIAGTAGSASALSSELKTATLAIGKDGSLFTVFADANGDHSIIDYGPHPTPASTPLRVIAGPHVALPRGNMGLPAGTSALAVSPTDGALYALGSGQINVYAPQASGDAAPVRIIAGPATGFGSASIAVDAAGRIYTPNAAGTAVLVFAANANGNAAPIATIAPKEMASIATVAISP